MINPVEIRAKAERLYQPCVAAWLVGDESFFPRVLRVDLQADPTNVVAAAEAVRRLKEASREEVGHGFTIEWREVNSRRFGRNRFPQRIVFPSRDDLLRYLGKVREFSALVDAVGRLRAAFPELESWIRENPRILMEAGSDLNGLIEVTRYLCDHPRPQRFARELPLSVDTKFVERRQPLLRAWLDRLLPPSTIAADEEHFERRFGLRYAEPHVLIRLLDPTLRVNCGLPWDEFSLPIQELRRLDLRDLQVVIVENKVTLLTLPMLPKGIALGGLGRAVTLLRDVKSLVNAKIAYWGDIDVAGFEILSTLRAVYPHVRSLMMDHATIVQWRSAAIPWKGDSYAVPLHLTNEEQEAFLVCRDEGIRLEQERLPQVTAASAVTSLL